MSQKTHIKKQSFEESQKEHKNYLIETKNLNNENEDEDEDNISEIKLKKFFVDWHATSMTISDVIEYIQSGDLIIPSYQRSYVWSKKEADEFIESLLMGIPTPSIILCNNVSQTDNKDTKYIVDGLQRIKTVLDYTVNESFEKNSKKTWKLNTKQNEDWNNKKFSELNEEDRKRIKRTKLLVIEIKLKNSSRDAVFNIFARINKSGQKLSFQQIRNALFGNENELLNSLNKFAEKMLENEKIILKDKNKKADKHQEFILRIIAFYFWRNKKINWNNSLTLMLNDCAEFLKVNQKDSEIKKFVLHDFQTFFEEFINNEIHKELETQNQNNDQTNNVTKTTTNPLYLESEFIAFLESKTENKIFQKNNEKIKKMKNELIEFSNRSWEDKNNPFYIGTHNETKLIERINFFKKIYEL